VSKEVETFDGDTVYVCSAIIESARVGFDRDVFLSVWLTLDFGGSVQGFGGYVLGGTPDCAAGRHDTQKNICAEFIVSCLLAGDVDRFDKLVGKAIRVKKRKDAWGDIIAIGHIVKDDRWFCPSRVLGEMTKELRK